MKIANQVDRKEVLQHRNKLALILSLNRLMLGKLSEAGPRQPEKDFIPGYRKFSQSEYNKAVT